MTSSLEYVYHPKSLVASYARLKDKESELMDRVGAARRQAKTPLMTGLPSSTINNNVGIGFPTQQQARMIVAATQVTGGGLPESDISGFCFRAEKAIEQAALEEGANLILLPELWFAPYFCQSQQAELLALADPVEDSVLIKRMQLLAKLYNAVLAVSLFERKNTVFYNSVAMIDADGSYLGTYRKTHIPDGTGYQEKFYFTPGDSGFKVFHTMVGNVGVAICWDQWFPEAARALALQGADIILYPTAIGSEPQNPALDSADHWQRVMQGHAAANMIPIVASNRFGTEILLNDDGTEKQRIKFYGRSFITDNKGAIMAECRENTASEPVTVVTAEIDVTKHRDERAAWGLFRDRRPSMYRILLSKDGAIDG